MQENEAAQKLLRGNEEQGNAAAQLRDTKASELERNQEQPFLLRILVVEDDPTLATLEAGVLRAHGFTVEIVNSGERAIATLHHSLPDLVVLDIELTGSIQGWEVLQAVRAAAPIPVLLTTSFSQCRARTHTQPG